MSCIFCRNKHHFSQNCDIYVSDEDRQNILSTKNYYCTQCLLKQKTFQCCFFYQKCYICFSRTHHTVYCRHRFTAPNIFIPKIDKDLLLRFLEILAFEEKYLLIFLCPKILKAIHLKPVIIYSKNISYLQGINEFLGIDIIAADKGIITNETMKPYFKILIRIKVKTNTVEDDMYWGRRAKYFRIKHLELTRTSISSNEFLSFLSTATTKLECKETNFDEKLNFRDILINAPNLEEIVIHLTNIKFDNFWPNEILEFNRSKLMKQISISIKNLCFNAESLAILMKKKSVAVSLFVNLFYEKIFCKQEIMELANSKFSNHFIFFCDTKQPLRLSISYASNSAGKIETEVFNMKNL